MSEQAINRILGFALFFTAYWFFGNLYEAIAMIPNHIYDPVNVVIGYKAYFVFSSATVYFVPLTQLGFAAIILAYFKVEQAADKQQLKLAAWLSGGALLLTAVIVTQIHANFFSEALATNQSQLRFLALALFAANLVRMGLVGFAMLKLFKLYIRRQIGRNIIHIPS